jgi:hypothetical protein
MMARAQRQRSAFSARVAPDQIGSAPGTRIPNWRFFQLAFVLMNLPGLAAADTTQGRLDREAVELLFFPTGGGKTEAYLGLAAFTLVHRRLHSPGIESAGVTVLMRYTPGLIQSPSQVPLLGLSAWAGVGGIASSLCSKALLPQPIST